nr:FKBP-type peptidyl-prolyl cis-trans isomerase [uncultured Blautia sp.]
MKKKVVAAMLVTCMAVSLTACGSKDASKTETAKTEDTSDKTEAAKADSKEDDSKKDEVRIVSVKDVSDYVTIGDYKGFTLDRYTQAVTDDDVTAEIDYELQDKGTEVTDGTVENGDTVTINYTGTVDGKEFDGGSEQDYDLVVGEGSMGIDGFEEGLIGMKKGETKELDLTLPEGYSEDDSLSGKEVVFKVTLQKFTRASELTDDWVAANTDYKTVDEYKKSVRENLEKQANMTADNELYATAWAEVIDSSEIKKYPEEDVKTAEESYRALNEQTAKDNGMELSDLLEAWNLTEEEFDEECRNYAESKVEQNLIVQGIMDAEGLSLNDKETEELKNNLILDYGVENVDELVELYGEDEVNESLALLRVEKFIVEQSTVNEKTGSPEDSIENEDAYMGAEDTGSDLTEYDESDGDQGDTEEDMSEEEIEDDTVEE